MGLLYFCHGVSHIRRSGTDGQLSVSAVAGRRLKKRRRRGSGASVSGGVSGVTEEATIKISKSGGRGSGLGKNRLAEHQRWELFRRWKKKTQCWSYVQRKDNGTRKKSRRKRTREGPVLCYARVDVFPSWCQSSCQRKVSRGAELKPRNWPRCRVPADG